MIKSSRGKHLKTNQPFKCTFIIQADMATPQLLSILILAFYTLSVSAQLAVYVSIDCGSSEQYQDENLIAWSGDDNYTSTGESRVVGSNNSISRVMDSLRVFNNSRNKNCYSIESVRRGRVLLRVSFYYGNYDNRSMPPTFDLQYDGNYWATVETSSSDYVYYEAIYVMKGDSISVCVAQTRRGEFPFISAIEVRGLETYMYSNLISGNYPLYLMRRYAYGSNSTVRFGEDPYDRIWTPALTHNTNGLIDLTSNTTFSELTIASDRPPPTVLQHAITANQSNTTIQLSTGFTSIRSEIYMNWYFTELNELGRTDTRSFRLFLNYQPFSDPIEPPYQNCTQWSATFSNATINDTISLVPTNVSTLAPLINAMEVFLIGNELTNGTNRNDVQGLNSLRDAFGVLEDWTGDPCLPFPFTWDWIQCNNDTEPRVTALLLGSFSLSGVLPDFSSMNALQTIDLHNNSLSGPIPDFLGTLLPNLTQLNLANNQFTGSIPFSLSSNNGINLMVTGNSGLCTTGNLSCPTSTPQNPRNTSGSNRPRNKLSIVFDTIIASFIFIWFIMY